MDELRSSGWTHPAVVNLNGIPTLTRHRWVLWAGHSKELGRVPCGIFVPAAIAMAQLTWPQALAHLDQKYKLAEEERCCGNGPAVVFVYGELSRKSVANRAEWKDRSLDLAVVFGEPDRQVMEVARTRLLPTSVCRNSSGSNPSPVSANDKAKVANSRRR